MKLRCAFIAVLLVQTSCACLADAPAGPSVDGVTKIEVRGGALWQLPSAYLSVEAIYGGRRYILAEGKPGANGSVPVDLAWLAGRSASLQVRLQSNTSWLPPEGMSVAVKVLAYKAGSDAPETITWQASGPNGLCQQVGDRLGPVDDGWVSQRGDEVLVAFQANRAGEDHDRMGAVAVLPFQVNVSGAPDGRDFAKLLATNSIDSWPIVDPDAKISIDGAPASPMSTIILNGGMTPDAVLMYKDLFELAPDLCVETHGAFPKWFIAGAKERGWRLAYQDNTCAFYVGNPAAEKGLTRDKIEKDPVTGEERFVAAWDFQNPELLATIRKHIQSVHDSGLDFATSCDFVWPYYLNAQGWGFSKNMKAAYIQDLEGTDEGLDMAPSFAKLLGLPAKCHFWDYFQAYHGFRWTPADVGLRSWAEFDPEKTAVADWSEPHTANLRSSKADAYKLSALRDLTRTYELLRFAQRVGKYTQEITGKKIRLILNPEHWGNHSDHMWLIGLDAIGDIKNEIFYDASRIPPLYYHGGYYSWIGDWIGKSSGLCYEVQGSRAVFYWGPSYKYFSTIMGFAAGPFASHEDDPFLDWSHIDKVNHTVCWEAGVQARRTALGQGIRKVKSPVLCLGTRSIYMDFPQAEQSWGMAIYGCEMPYFLGGYLMRDNIPYDFGDELLFDEATRRNGYSTIVYSPAEYQVGFEKKLSKWMNGKGGRTIITHSFVPFRPKQGVNFAKYTDMTYAEPSTPLSEALGVGRFNGLTTVTGKAVGADGKAITGAPIEWKLVDTTIRGKILATVDGRPLVSEYRPKDGGRVIYLHMIPVVNPGTRRNLDATFKAHQQLMAWVMRQVGVVSKAPTQDRWWFPMVDATGRQIWAYQAFSLDDVMDESGGTNAAHPAPYVVRPFTHPELLEGMAALKGFTSLQTFTESEGGRLFDMGVFSK